MTGRFEGPVVPKSCGEIAPTADTAGPVKASDALAACSRRTSHRTARAGTAPRGGSRPRGRAAPRPGTVGAPERGGQQRQAEVEREQADIQRVAGEAVRPSSIIAYVACPGSSPVSC